MSKIMVTIVFIAKFIWWNFLILVADFLIKISIKLTPIFPNLLNGAEIELIMHNLHMIAVIVLTCIYLPIKTYFIGYKEFQAKCPGCKEIFTYSECTNCRNSKFLHDFCLVCGEYDLQIADTKCGDCGTNGLKFRAK